MKKIKVKVKKQFTDRITGQIRKPGEMLEVTDARLREIRRSGADYVEVVKETAPAKDAAPAKAPEAKEKK